MKTRNKEPDIRPEQLYSAGQAARYFGVHRCTVYDYVNNHDRPLSYLLTGHSSRFMFLGQTLIEYKQAGLPKKGRKRMT